MISKVQLSWWAIWWAACVAWPTSVHGMMLSERPPAMIRARAGGGVSTKKASQGSVQMGKQWPPWVDLQEHRHCSAPT